MRIQLMLWEIVTSITFTDFDAKIQSNLMKFKYFRKSCLKEIGYSTNFIIEKSEKNRPNRLNYTKRHLAIFEQIRLKIIIYIRYSNKIRRKSSKIALIINWIT